MAMLQKNGAFPVVQATYTATANTMWPDSELVSGLRLLLEPVDKPNRSDTAFTDSLQSAKHF